MSRSTIKTAGQYIKCDFPQILDTNVRILIRWVYDCVLPNLSPFIDHPIIMQFPILRALLKKPTTKFNSIKLVFLLTRRLNSTCAYYKARTKTQIKHENSTNTEKHNTKPTIHKQHARKAT